MSVVNGVFDSGSPRETSPTSLLWVGLFLVTLGMAACDGGESLGPSTPTHLAFVVEPAPVGVGSPVSPSVAVAILDKKGETVWTWTEPVSVALEWETGPASLLGTTTVVPVGGTALFNDLGLPGPGSGFRLVATSGTLEEAVSRPFAVHDIFRSAAVSNGGYHTCAVRDDGIASCWGKNTYGQLGDGTQADRLSPTPVSTELRFVTLTSGSFHTCGLTDGGSVYCWGNNLHGELGSQTTETCTPVGGTPTPCSTTPILLGGGPVWKQVSAGDQHTCGLTVGGEMLCWGENETAQLGDGTTEGRSEPTPVAGGHSFTQIGAGYQHSCGLEADGSAYCWGRNIYGEVGDGAHDRRLEPTLVAGGHRFQSVFTGGGSCHGHTCGITLEGDTYCWGRNYQRHIAPFTDVLLYSPTPLVDDPGFEALVIGNYQICGLTASGALYCWGEGLYGAVGNGNTNDQELPTPIRPDLKFSSVSSGRYHTCAVTGEGHTYCWGKNNDGQLGNQSNPHGWTTPVSVWGF